MAKTFKVYFGDGPLEGQFYRTRRPVATLRFRDYAEDAEYPGTYKPVEGSETMGHVMFAWEPDESE